MLAERATTIIFSVLSLMVSAILSQSMFPVIGNPAHDLPRLGGGSGFSGQRIVH
jgi:hypothetical protein